MAERAFVDQDTPPSQADLAAVLGPASRHWNAIVQGSGSDEAAWKRYSRKSGWTLVVRRKGRTLVYLAPHTKSFKAVLILGERAYASLAAAGLPPEVVARFAAARPYAEGRGADLTVKSARDVTVVLRLIEIKTAPAGDTKGKSRR